uniref:Uncharacterized protein n=1 Tax=Setaria italica TaxID=4555 RepID=K4A3W2_SETIT
MWWQHKKIGSEMAEKAENVNMWMGSLIGRSCRRYFRG